MKVSMMNFRAKVFLMRGQGVYCSCGNHLYEVSNGIFGESFICEKCHKIYQLELRSVPVNKITKEYMDQAIKELEVRKR